MSMADNTEPKLPLIGKKRPICKTWTDTEIKIMEASHTWRIRNFNYCVEETGQALESERFSSGSKDDDKWYLQLYPNGDKEESANYVSFHLNLESCAREPILTTVKFIIHNDKMETFKSFESKQSFTVGRTWGYTKFIRKDLLLKRAKEALPNDILTLSCEIIINESTSKISGKENIKKLNDPSACLLENFAHLLETETLSDVTLVAGQREFKAHKAILSAHSSVFAAMFQHEMLEQKENRVDVIDLEQDVVEKMLRFMYTGQVENIEEMADSLLVAADKYGIDSLKLLCQEQLNTNLSMENASLMLILADLHNVDWLKKQTIQFINKYKIEITNTESFKSAVISHPHLIIEALINSSAMQTDDKPDQVMDLAEDEDTT